jgi:hypothetical protein
VNLVHVPIGTALGIYTFWILTRADVAAVFRGGRLAAGPPQAPPA